MNNIMVHLENEYYPKLEVDLGNENYTVIRLGEELTLFLSPFQADELFDELDKKLHGPTTTCKDMKNEIAEKEDIIFNLQSELDDANDKIEMYEDNINEKI